MTAGLEHDPVTGLGTVGAPLDYIWSISPPATASWLLRTDGAVRCGQPADARNSSSLAGVSIPTTCAGDIAEAERMA